ncbi:MAG TPA: hypothetical protein VMZ71_13195 [Gemmataceae bacterium]|nr:hypothetical protein [Gemmataceae bacterium]
MTAGHSPQREPDADTARVLAAARVGYLTADFAQLTKRNTVEALSDGGWQECRDPLAMLCYLHGRSGGRKFRLFAAACARDEFASGTIPAGECPTERLPRYYDSILEAEAFADGGPALSFHLDPFHWVAQPVCDVITDEDVAHAALGFNADVGLWTTPIEEIVPRMIARYHTHPAHYIRDIFGNPFRPVSFAPSWGTSTAIALARQMYEARDFSAMPILADALQDAGCADADILGHCRGDGPHVRGCWVLDLVLGRE